MSTVQPAPEIATFSRHVAARRERWPLPPAAALLGVAAVLFVAYPVLRPYSSESGLAGARAFGSDRWVIAHLCGMVAFGCFAAAACSLTSRLARVSVLLGVGLLLPYYGAEAFGLHALGDAALNRGDASLIDVAGTVRNNLAALIMFGAGWIALAVAGAASARALWAADMRTGAVLVGAGLVLYLPQFFGPPWMRIVHGVLLGVGLAIVAVQARKRTRG